MFDEELGSDLGYGYAKRKTREGEWECGRCGHVREGRKPPQPCPDCGADADEFSFWEYDEDWDEDDDDD